MCSPMPLILTSSVAFNACSRLRPLTKQHPTLSSCATRSGWPGLGQKTTSTASTLSNRKAEVKRLSTTAASMAAIYGTPAMETVVIKPTVQHTASIVWCHGLGDTAAGWTPIADMLAMPHVKWILPTAPVRPVTINGGAPCTAWFDIFGISPNAIEDTPGMDAAALYIADLLRQEAAAGVPESSIGVGGFSMGGALALYVATKAAGGKLVAPVGAAAAISSWLPGFRDVPQPIAGKANMPIALFHGQDDFLVPATFGAMSKQVLETAGYQDVQYKAYRGVAHEVSPAELGDVRTWLLRHFPSASGAFPNAEYREPHRAGDS
eukprot:jgi/Chlat1/8835/Chrsp91S08166